jgi:hypothetical protein
MGSSIAVLPQQQHHVSMAAAATSRTSTSDVHVHKLSFDMFLKGLAIEMRYMLLGV